MTDTPPRHGLLLDLLKAWMPILVVVVGAVWTLLTYLHNENEQAKALAANAEDETRAALVQARQPFLERKMKLFFETSDLTATLSGGAASAPAARATAEERFWRLYWGEMSIVEKGQVERCMMAFGNALRNHKAAPTSGSRSVLKVVSYRLAHAMRYELLADWADPELAGQSKPKDCPAVELTPEARAPRS